LRTQIDMLNIDSVAPLLTIIYRTRPPRKSALSSRKIKPALPVSPAAAQVPEHDVTAQDLAAGLSDIDIDLALAVAHSMEQDHAALIAGEVGSSEERAEVDAMSDGDSLGGTAGSVQELSGSAEEELADMTARIATEPSSGDCE